MSTTRRLFVASAILVAGAVWLPYWGFVMSAPQYPDESLVLNITHRGISGDVQEVSTLQQYIGVRFPEELDELEMLIPAMFGLAAVLIAAGFAGAGRTGRIARWASVAVFLGFLVFCAQTVQRHLYAVGHDRDRDAPITAIKDFTPRLIGPTKVGNFTVWSFPHVGGLTLVAAMSLAAVGSMRSARS